MTIEMWALIMLTPILSYLNFRWGVYGFLCGKARFQRKIKEELKNGQAE